MSFKRILFAAGGAVLVGAVVVVFALASMPHAQIIPINDLARLVKSGQVASIEVKGLDAIATTSQKRSFGVRVEQPGTLLQLLESFGVTSEELGCEWAHSGGLRWSNQNTLLRMPARREARTRRRR